MKRREKKARLAPAPNAPNARPRSKSFKALFKSEKANGIVLIICTIVSLLLANSRVSAPYLSVWQKHIGGLSVELWINDLLMAVFFLFIGLELKRELHDGELSNIKSALLPVVAAIGGMCLPGLIHFTLNSGTPTQAGIGIPIATDIVFALGVLALLGRRVPASLKAFLTALAVIDDLGAILVIAIFYTARLSISYLAGAIGVLVLLVALNRLWRVKSLVPYLLGGALLWFLMLKSGVHATIAGVLLAFAIPLTPRAGEEESPSLRLERVLQTPVAFVILPIFAMANTSIVIGRDWTQSLASANSLGILGGLVLGKPFGITCLSLLAVAIGICKLPRDLNWRHIFGAGILGGIGFTMSIFVTNLAFGDSLETVNASKIAILLASLTAGTLGYVWLRLLTSRPV